MDDQLLVLIEGACKELGRGREDAIRIRTQLCDAWLDSREALSALDDEGWRALGLPQALVSKLRQRLAEPPPSAVVAFADDTGERLSELAELSLEGSDRSLLARVAARILASPEDTSARDLNAASARLAALAPSGLRGLELLGFEKRGTRLVMSRVDQALLHDALALWGASAPDAQDPFTAAHSASHEGAAEWARSIPTPETVAPGPELPLGAPLEEQLVTPDAQKRARSAAMARTTDAPLIRARAWDEARRFARRAEPAAPRAALVRLAFADGYALQATWHPNTPAKLIREWALARTTDNAQMQLVVPGTVLKDDQTLRQQGLTPNCVIRVRFAVLKRDAAVADVQGK